MIKEFVVYEQALALRELGFDEPCMGYYMGKDKEVYISNEEIQAPFEPNLDSKIMFRAPLYSQCFRWFRKKYNLFHNIWNYTHGEPTDLIPNGFTFSIDEDWITIIGKKEDGYFEKYYNTYEEAEETCINKLIEIVKNK